MRHIGGFDSCCTTFNISLHIYVVFHMVRQRYNEKKYILGQKVEEQGLGDF